MQAGPGGYCDIVSGLIPSQHEREVEEGKEGEGGQVTASGAQVVVAVFEVNTCAISVGVFDPAS